jgi:excisionase family DNA binding protein
VDATRDDVRAEARMSVEEAARNLGIKEESVRKRIRRGKMRSEKDEAGRLYVYVDASNTVPDEHVDEPEDLYSDRSVDMSGGAARELIDAKDEIIRILQGQLQEEREARRRADTIIARLTQADALARGVPELEASQTHEEAAERAAESGAEKGVHGRNAIDDPRDSARPRDTAEFPVRGSLTRPWWRRVFGG